VSDLLPEASGSIRIGTTISSAGVWARGARLKDKNMKSKRRAAYLLLVFSSVLLLVATWNIAESPAQQGAR